MAQAKRRRKRKIFSPVYLTLVLIVLYLPILMVVIYSFNSGRTIGSWQGFTTDWYSRLFSNALMADALKNSLVLAVVSSLLAGGIGTRGPGESKLEMNRRHIRERMTELRRRLDAVEKQRELRRKSREKNEIPVVALVGYTNAGKSTLLNQMTGSDVYVQDQLFATLDAVSRRIETAEHTPFLLVDTVGFIRKLPHALVSAFRSTLEEAVLADVLVIVNDGASEEIMQQHDTVVQVLSDLGATEQPRIEVINKCDLYTDEAGAPMLIPGAVRLSAKTGEGIAELHARIAEQLQKTYAPVTFVLPFDRFGLVGQIRPLGRVVNEEYTDTGLELTVVLANADRDRLVSKYGKEILKG